MLKKTLQRVSIRTGNNIAYILLTLTVGFAFGWVLHVEYIYDSCSFY